MRAPLHREATIRLRVDDDSGALVAPDSTPTFTVTDQNGSSVTAGAVSSVGVGLYEAVIPGRSVLGTLTCQWGYAVSGSARTTTDVVSVTEKRLVPLWLSTRRSSERPVVDLPQPDSPTSASVSPG